MLLFIPEESQKEDVSIAYNTGSGGSYSGAYTLFCAQMRALINNLVLYKTTPTYG